MNCKNIANIELIFNNSNNNIDIIEYQYILALIFELFYIKTVQINEIEQIKNIFNQINFPEGKWNMGDHELISTYLYLFNKIKYDINKNNFISENTKIEMIIILDKMITGRALFKTGSVLDD